MSKDIRKMINKVKNLKRLLKEQEDKELNISNIFNKYEHQFNDEFNDDNWIKMRENIINGLRQSLELIGNGQIIEKSKYDFDGDRLMYKELFNNNKLILVVHAAFEKHPYGGGKLYRYEIGVYRNNPRTQQIGGGYGASGIMSIEHTKLLHSIDNYCRNKNVISATCSEVKKFAEENF